MPQRRTDALFSRLSRPDEHLAPPSLISRRARFPATHEIEFGSELSATEGDRVTGRTSSTLLVCQVRRRWRSPASARWPTQASALHRTALSSPTGESMWKPAAFFSSVAAQHSRL